VICVVARVHDLIAIERTGSMRGRYFVLGKLLSPLEGIGPEDLPIGRLVERIRGDSVVEVIVATPPSVDGEATALLLKRELAPLGVGLTRIASGVPHGGDLEFADPITMGRALAGRRAL
jgi:recombination protein RecR